MKKAWLSILLLSCLSLVAHADLARYQLDEQGQLHVSSDGFHFGPQQGAFPVQTVQKPFYYGRIDTLEIGMMLTPELGLAIINRTDLPQTPAVIGLPETAPALDKWFEQPAILFQYRNGTSSFYRIRIRQDGSFTATSLLDETDTQYGCWKADTRRSGYYHILLGQHTSTCEHFNPERTPFAPFYARAAMAASGDYLVMDYSDGSGFGLIVQPRPLPALIYPQHFKILVIDQPENQAAHLFSTPVIFDLVLTPEGNAIQTPLHCRRDQDSFRCDLTNRHATYRYHLNTFCHGRNMTPAEGIVCVTHENGMRFNLLPTPRQSAFIGGSIGAHNLIMGGRSTIQTLPDTPNTLQASK